MNDTVSKDLWTQNKTSRFTEVTLTAEALLDDDWASLEYARVWTSFVCAGSHLN